LQRRRIVPTISKIGPKLALCGVVSGLFLIGWAARHSVAQAPAQDSQSPPPLQAPPSGRPEEAKVAVPQSPAGTASELALPPPEAGAATEPTAAPEFKASADALAPVTGAAGNQAVEVDDPEKVAIVFVEHNYAHAEAQLKSLKEEAEKLRARLAKVEAGIKRWDRVLVALAQSQGLAAVAPSTELAPVSAKAKVVTPDDSTLSEPATDLSPVPANSKAVPRNSATKEPAPPAGDAVPGPPPAAGDAEPRAASFVQSPPLPLPEATKPADTPGDLVPRSR
jgi:hypothetical protein